ncbi:hypothetical protein SCHPADRAFT_947067 [Schizopora paradoxa]|uniref:Uncharacterized protein n=1 Tax=Schizopora paradoxa TaxID=27342 RepID=A0A0H2R0J4_9AGAM|nr:hypothetical protein SCHPADRAFT_947067 [Schizopora paradoxa]
MANTSFSKNFPNELTLKVFTCLAEPSPSPYDNPLLAWIDLGYFPSRDQQSLSQVLNVIRVNKHLLELGQSFLLKTVHLRTTEDVVAFHRLASPNAIMNPEHVEELSLVFEADEEALPVVFQQCAAILKHLPKLSKLDLARFRPSVVPYLFDAPNGPSAYDHFWNSIPNSLQHIIVQDPTFVPFLFQPNLQYEGRIHILDRFVVDHPKLEVWCFDEWFETEALRKVVKYREIWRKATVDYKQENFDRQIRSFAEQHVSRLLKNCRSVQICIDEISNPLSREVWVLPGLFPRVSFLCSSHAEHWPEDQRSTRIETLWVHTLDKTFRESQLNSILMQLPNLSTFVYNAPHPLYAGETRRDQVGTWEHVSCSSLTHVVAFIVLNIHGFDEFNIENLPKTYRKSLGAEYKNFAGLRDRERFPKLGRISLILDSYRGRYPDIKWRNALENDLQEIFATFATDGIEVTISWGSKSPLLQRLNLSIQGIQPRYIYRGAWKDYVSIEDYD